MERRGNSAELRRRKLQREPERKTPTAELRRMELRQMHSVLQRAEAGLSKNDAMLGWLTPWLQQDLLVPLDEDAAG